MAEDNGFAMGYALGQDTGGGGGFGGNFGEGLWAVIILAILFGRGGFGNFGGGDNGGGGFGWGVAPWATQADVRAAVDQQTLISKIDQQTYGIADTFTALNNTLNNNFRGIDNAVCNLGFNTQMGFNTLGTQLAKCCCDIEGGIERNTNAIQRQISDCCCDLEKMDMQSRFDAQLYNNNTLLAIDKLGDRIIGYMTDRDTQTLRDELQAMRLSASQAKQNQYLINELKPSPVPAYITCNPYTASWGVGYGGYGNNCGCGCGN